ncbi:hypothetical protein [Acinetobacter modestus]|uniref:hypothetical protein n=1 Tax=Acinetobacter modestus TaxID=1776740 RepID=UPI001F4B59A4|nr:hypothetical protein [Acinetobacter modestus]MCH7328609.1 hypothetical protein [Acinetobacter modestus]
MTTVRTVSFQKTVLASLIGFCISQSAFALQELSDDGLSQTTGEGIALLPQDSYFVFRGAGANETQADILDPTKRINDTGYIHYLPVGGLTSTVQDTNKDGNVNSADHSVGKADLYLYGLAISRNANNDSNSRLDSGLTSGIANAAIRSWGTATNPWLFKATTAKNVPNFSASTCTGSTDLSCQITYLNLEAPLYETTRPTTAANGLDAYNLKLALWADAFIRDQSKAEGNADQFKLGELFSTTHTPRTEEAERANRLRLQGVWNGFSINGSNLQMFQTLKGATDAGGLSYFYNNTFGMSGILRFNSGDASGLRAGITRPTVSRSQTTTLRYSTQDLNYVDSGTEPTDATFNGRIYQLRTKDTTDSIGAWSFTMPTVNSVLRFSTQECGAGNLNGCTTGTAQGLLASPGISGSGTTTAPNFSPNEGLFMYNPNINLVLGSLYQPVILGSDGKNFSLEITRIPNKEEIYKKIYTDYTGLDASYLGSTCNVYQCGTSELTGYQGGSPRDDYSATALTNKKLATHSSISIGTVETPDGGKTLQAFKGNATQDAIGISFGLIPTGTTNIAAKTNTYYQLEARLRTYYTPNGCVAGGAGTPDCTNNTTSTTANQQNRWTYATGLNSTGVAANPYGVNINSSSWRNFASFRAYFDWATDGGRCTNGTGTSNTCFDFAMTGGASNGSGEAGWIDVKSFDVAEIAAGYNPTIAHTAYTAGTNTARQITIPAWAALPTWNANQGTGANYSGTKWTSNPAPSTPNVGLNNMGSAVIDGLLIQHMKITTAGL